MENISIDQKDQLILRELELNSKLTTQQLSKKLQIPITTIHNRIKKLEKLGIIKSYTVKLDEKKLGFGISAYILVTVNYLLPSGRKVHQQEIAKRISKLPQVKEVAIVTGETDIIIKVIARDVSELNEFIIRELREIDGVDKTQTMVVLEAF